MNIFTRKRKRAYLASAPVYCPWCDNMDNEAGQVEVNKGVCTQDVLCGACGATWTDVYRLVDIVPD